MSADFRIKDSLSRSFSNSLSNETTACLSNIAEAGLDSILDDGIIKDIPFISTVISMYRIGHSIHDRYNINKLARFLDEMNQGTQNDEIRKKYIREFQENKKFRDQELEFVLVLLDRYVGYDKPQRLAKLYLSYLDKKITWDEFAIYAEIIDRFLPGDAELLCMEWQLRANLEKKQADSFARLVSLGLMSESVPQTKYVAGNFTLNRGQHRDHQITKFGEKLASILKMSLDCT